MAFSLSAEYPFNPTPLTFVNSESCDDDSLACISVTGQLFAWIETDSSDETISNIKGSILSSIRNSIGDGRYSTENIVKVVYSGKVMTEPHKGNIHEMNAEPAEQKNSKNAVWISLICVFIVVLISGLVIFLVRRHRNKVADGSQRRKSMHTNAECSMNEDSNGGNCSQKRKYSSESSSSCNRDTDNDCDGVPYGNAPSDESKDRGDVSYESNGGVNFILIGTPEDHI